MHQNIGGQEWLIGFDYRLRNRNLSERGSTAIWPPSYCIDPAFAERDEGIEARQEAGWIGPNRPLWSSLNELRIACTQSEQKGIEILAISILVTETLRIYQEARKLAFPQPETSPATLSDEWELVGYDVADRFYLSALYNIGFGLDAVKSKLNDHGLFIEPTPADDFARAADQFAPEHAPFFVFAMRLVLRLE